MTKKDYVQGIIDYFNGEQWTSFMNDHLTHEDEEVYHAHVYFDSSVHPKSLHPIMHAYFKAKGMPLDRIIDPQSPKVKVGGLHGIHPFGQQHFDWFFRFNADVVLASMPADIKEAEHGHNLLSWGKKYQDEFMSQFTFKTVGPREAKEIRDYFLSKHWKETLAFTVNPEVTHAHSNVEISFDPKIMELYASEALAKIGWTVEKVVPCVYDVNGTYTGKIVYLLGYPEKMFDICWKFNPDVTVRPAQEGWIFDTPGFDIWYYHMYNKVIEEGDFYELTQEEIDQVIASFNN
ncbi:MAG: hypothetical protein AB7G87_07505 [Clostridia bacterium]